VLVGNGAEYELFEVWTVVLGMAIGDLDCRSSVDVFIVAMNAHAGRVCVEELRAERDFLHDLKNYFEEEIG